MKPIDYATGMFRKGRRPELAGKEAAERRHWRARAWTAKRVATRCARG
jgi:hypothetical protein